MHRCRRFSVSTATNRIFGRKQPSVERLFGGGRRFVISRLVIERYRFGVRRGFRRRLMPQALLQAATNAAAWCPRCGPAAHFSKRDFEP